MKHIRHTTLASARRSLAIALAATLLTASAFTGGVSAVAPSLAAQTRLATGFVYDDMQAPSGGFAAVSVDGRWGYIDLATTELVIEPLYTAARPFGATHGAVRGDNGLWALVDTSGELVTGFDYAEPPSGFQDGAVVADGATGLCALATNGVPFTAFAYADVRIGAGVHAVKLGGKWGFVDDFNQTVVDFTYDAVGDFSRGIAAVCSGGRWGVIDSAGVAIIDCEWDNATVSDGNVSLKRGDTVAVADPSGAVFSSTIWKDIGVFQRDRCAVKIGTRWGFVDNNGNLVVAARFDAAIDSRYGAPVRTAKGYGYMVGDGAYTIAGAVGMCRRFDGYAVYPTAGGYAFVYADGSTWGGGLEEVRVGDDPVFMRAAAVKLNGKWALYYTSGHAPQGGYVENQGSDYGSEWAREELERAVSLGLTAALDWSLDDWTQDITREQFCGLVVTLYEMLGGDYPAEMANRFTDTDSIAVIKAAGVGIVTGRTATGFAPAAPITREELCVMLDRTLGLLGLQLASVRGDTLHDLDSVSGFARDAVTRLYGAGIINGSRDGDRVMFNPRDHATIEQAIVIVHRAITN